MPIRHELGPHLPIFQEGRWRLGDDITFPYKFSLMYQSEINTSVQVSQDFLHTEEFGISPFLDSGSRETHERRG